MPEWSKGGDLRSSVFARVGSNPTHGNHFIPDDTLNKNGRFFSHQKSFLITYCIIPLLQTKKW